MLLTIVTINYNNQLGLENTLKSIAFQTCKDFEYVIIDGGSVDGSVNIIEQYKTHIDYWVSESDRGIYHAMNKGVEKSTGEYILFLNSGDSLPNEQTVSEIINSIKETDQIIYGDVFLYNPKTHKKTIHNHPENLKFSYFYKTTICHQACIIKKALFREIFLFSEEYKICSDWEFLIYAYTYGKVRFRKINVLVAIYSLDGLSSDKEQRKVMAEERRQIINKHFQVFNEDYQQLKLHSSNRSKQLLTIEKFKFLRGLVSIIFSIILKIMPKK